VYNRLHIVPYGSLFYFPGNSRIRFGDFRPFKTDRQINLFLYYLKMPRNITGGSGHKSRRNGEGNATKKNRGVVEDFIYDITNDGECEGVHMAKVTKKMGDGRMETFYFNKHNQQITVIAPLKGSMRGRGKSQTPVDVGSIVLLNETGLGGGISHEIFAVLTSAQAAHLQKLLKLDDRMAPKIEGGMDAEDGFAFDHGEEENVDVDTI
jgi:hypothetical protein